MSRFKSMPEAIHDPADFGRVAVMFGGSSAEREVSLLSGEAVLKALLAKGVDAHAFDPAQRSLTEVAEYERVFIALHGRGGEDGTMQGALQALGVPYTGSGVLGSALGMDKVRSKHVWSAMGLPTPASRTITNTQNLDEFAEALGFPLMVKPASEGSSIGMARVVDPDSLLPACERALRSDSVVLLEQWIEGPEYTCSVLAGEALPLIRLKTKNAFYDYEAKYESDSTEYLCPCGLSETQEKTLQTLALKAFSALAASAWGRVDIMCDTNGNPWLLEINTVPGMTSHSLVPMAAAQQGIDFASLCWRVLETSLEDPCSAAEGENHG